jgi:hypothetical protein
MVAKKRIVVWWYVTLCCFELGIWRTIEHCPTWLDSKKTVANLAASRPTDEEVAMARRVLTESHSSGSRISI